MHTQDTLEYYVWEGEWADHCKTIKYLVVVFFVSKVF